MLENCQTSTRRFVPFNRELRWRWLDIRRVLALLTFDGDTSLRIGRVQAEFSASTTTATHLFRVDHHDATLRTFSCFGTGAS